MMLELAFAVRDHREALTEIAWGAMPLEACGLLYKGRLVRVPNVAEEPHRTFAMDYAVQLQYIEDMGMPLAMWHTHPGGRECMSEADARMAAELPEVGMVIVTPGGSVRAWLSGQEVGLPVSDNLRRLP